MRGKRPKISMGVFFLADQCKNNKMTGTLRLLLSYGSRFIYKSIWQKCYLSLSSASNLNLPLTFSKSYGRMKSIFKATAEWFATWNNNVVNFSPVCISNAETEGANEREKISSGKCWHGNPASEWVLSSKRKNYTQETHFQQISLSALWSSSENQLIH